MSIVNSSAGVKNESETVFAVGGEGGAICIFRQRDGAVEKFSLSHEEFDPTDEGLEVNIKKVYRTFEEAFQYIDSRYPWYSLYIISVHADFRDFIIKRLNEILIEKSISTETSNYNRAGDIYEIEKNLSRSLKDWERY